MTFQPGGADLPRQVKTAFGSRGLLGLNISEEIVPIIELGPNAEPPFNTKWGGFGSVVAQGDATHPGSARLSNPAASGTVIVLRRIVVSNTNVAGRELRIEGDGADSGPGDVAGLIGAWSPDIQRPAGLLRGDIDQNAAIGNYRLFLEQYAPTTIEGPWVIRPGREWRCSGVTNNEFLVANFYWDEYQIL